MVSPAQPLVGHWSNNKPFPGSSANTAAMLNPATGQVTGRVALATSEHARAVIDAAQTGVATWRDASLAKRTAVLFKFRELLKARKGEIAAIITNEQDKVLSDEVGEVSRGKEVIEVACGFNHLVHTA